MAWITLPTLLTSIFFAAFLFFLMMLIAPDSRARKGGRERREVKGEYGGI